MNTNDYERDLLIRKINQTLSRMTLKELEALCYHLDTQSLSDDEER